MHGRDQNTCMNELSTMVRVRVVCVSKGLEIGIKPVTPHKGGGRSVNWAIRVILSATTLTIYDESVITSQQGNI